MHGSSVCLPRQPDLSASKTQCFFGLGFTIINSTIGWLNPKSQRLRSGSSSGGSHEAAGEKSGPVFFF